MTTYSITPALDCKFCHGTGEVHESHPYGSTCATETLTCECVLEQLPEDFEDGKDTVVIEPNELITGPEFEYDDYLDGLL